MSLTSDQQEKVSMFTMVCGVDTEIAKAFLIRREWDCELAIDTFFAEGNSGQVEIAPPAPVLQPQDSESIETLFAKYAAQGGKQMEGEGIQQFCEELGISPLEPVILVISKHFKAETMGVFSKAEFCDGMATLGCSKIADLVNKLPELKGELDNPRKFKETYRFVFNFARDPGMRDLGFETAVALWELLLQPKQTMTENFIAFLKSQDKQHDISKDTWNMLLDLFEEIGGDLKNFDEMGSWPNIIDEFVEFENSKS